MLIYLELSLSYISFLSRSALSRHKSEVFRLLAASMGSKKPSLRNGLCLEVLCYLLCHCLYTHIVWSNVGFTTAKIQHISETAKETD